MVKNADLVEDTELPRGKPERGAGGGSTVKRGAGGKRRLAREMAVQMLYQWDLGGSSLPQLFRAFDPWESVPPRKARAAAAGEGETFSQLERHLGEAFSYARYLVEGTVEHQEEVDELIRGQADNWRLERMASVDRNILRLAVFELLHEEDVPKLVVMDEAIELAKKFGSEQSGRFVNGILDGLLKQKKFPGRLT